MKPIIVKANINKKTNQASVTIPKRKIKKYNPDIKFGKNIFVRIEVLHRGR